MIRRLLVVALLLTTACASSAATSTDSKAGWVNLGGGLTKREVDPHTTCYRSFGSLEYSMSCVYHP